MTSASWLQRARTSPNYPRYLLFTCLAGMYSTTFTATILTVSIARVARDLHSTPSVVAWVITAPMLAAAVAMPLLGRLGDIRGHRLVYLTGFSFAIAFSVLTALARNPAWLIAGRTLAQLAASSTIPASFAMLFQSFPPDQRVRASAWISATLSGASVSGLVIGGPIIDSIGWRPLFLIQAGLASVALLGAIVILRKDEHKVRMPIDLQGAALLALTVFCATFGINRMAATGFSLWLVGLLAVVPIGTWLLWRTERSSSAPLLPVKIIGQRNIRLGSVASFALGGSWIGSFVVTPLLLESVFHYSATVTSLVTLSRTGMIVVAAPSASRLGVRFGERRILICATFMTAVGMAILALGAHHQAIAVIVGGMLLSGASFGHAQPAMVTVMANAADEEDFGLATSLQQTSNQIGSVVGLGLATALAANATTTGPFTWAFLLSAGLAVLAAVVATRVRPSERLIATGMVAEDTGEPSIIVAEEFSRRA